LAFDISLVRVQTPIVFTASVGPVALSHEFTVTHTGAQVSGWGQTWVIKGEVICAFSSKFHFLLYYFIKHAPRISCWEPSMVGFGRHYKRRLPFTLVSYSSCSHWRLNHLHIVASRTRTLHGRLRRPGKENQIYFMKEYI
jgi:hypothetical protein